MPAFPTESAAEAARLRAAGLRWADVAKRFGRPINTVKTWVKTLETRHPELMPEPPADDDQSDGDTKAEFRASGNEATASLTTKNGRPVRSLDDLAQECDIDLDTWYVRKWVANTWGNPNNQNWQAKASLERVPEWLAEPIERKPLNLAAKSSPSEDVALILPDVQFGFMWDDDRRELQPLHDEVACQLALSIAEIVDPGIIVHVGDLLDLAPFSTKYTTHPGLRYTSQPSLQAAHDWLADIRALCPDAPFHVIEGNHEARIYKALADLLDEAVALKPVHEKNAAMGLPHLLGLDHIGVQYHEGYPDAEVWLWDDLVRVIHGTVVRQGGGATVAAIAKQMQYSTICGHIHRLEMCGRTIHGPKGARNLWAASPGTLSRVDGIVPGSSKPDWQQGVTVLHRVGDCVHVEMIPMENGVAVVRGEVVRVEGG